MYQKLKLVDDL